MIALSTTVVKKILTEYEALFALDQSKHYVYNDQLSILDFILGQQLIATNFVSYDYSQEFPNLHRYFIGLAKAHPIFQDELNDFLVNLKPLQE